MQWNLVASRGNDIQPGTKKINICILTALFLVFVNLFCASFYIQKRVITLKNKSYIDRLIYLIYSKIQTLARQYD